MDFSELLANIPEYAGYGVLILSGVAGIFSAVKGPQPEKFIEEVLLPILKKISRK